MIKTIREFLHIFFKKFLPKTRNRNFRNSNNQNFKEIPDIFRYLKCGILGKFNARVPFGAARRNDGNKR